MLNITGVVFDEFRLVLLPLCHSTTPRPVSPLSHHESCVVGMESRNSHHTFFVRNRWVVRRLSIRCRQGDVRCFIHGLLSSFFCCLLLVSWWIFVFLCTWYCCCRVLCHLSFLLYLSAFWSLCLFCSLLSILLSVLNFCSVYSF